MQEGETTLQFKGKQTSQISSKITHKLASVHLKTIPLCALAVIWALGDLGSIMLGQPPSPDHPATHSSPSPAVQACKGRSENLSPDGLMLSHSDTPEHPGLNPAIIIAGESEHEPRRDAVHT